MDGAARNTGVHVSVSTMVSAGYIPSGGIAGSHGSFIPSFLISILFSIMVVSGCTPTDSVRGFPFLHTLSSLYFFVDFLMMAILMDVR